jgi:predicted CXXCH cytochrome family protein
MDQLCVTCHGNMFLDMKAEDLHKPFRSKECDICHNPHASDYIANTIKPMTGLCYDCHNTLEEMYTISIYKHLPMEEGHCIACHNPHGAKIDSFLLNRPRELCLSCHERIVVTTVRKGHLDMEEGDCLSCHLSHFSELKHLLTTEDPALCVKCHSIDTASLQKKHIKPLDEINHCLTCHVPHVTEKPGLLKKIQHKPFARGNCSKCHE